MHFSRRKSATKFLCVKTVRYLRRLDPAPPPWLRFPFCGLWSRKIIKLYYVLKAYEQSRESVVSYCRNSCIKFSVLTVSTSMVCLSFLLVPVVNSSTHPGALSRHRRSCFSGRRPSQRQFLIDPSISDFNSLFSVPAQYRYLSHRPAL